MLPLADVRIIAVEQYGAGPWGSLQLADLGAEVIKIEDPASQGDVGRYVPPFQEGEDSLFFETFNRNKKSICLDLKQPFGRRVFEDLVRASDAVLCNLRGDQPKQLRLTYDDLRQVNERVVCCSLSGFGMTGPRASAPGYDYMMQGLAGWMSVTGEPGGPPVKTGPSLVDLSGGYVAAIALLAGLWRARRDGSGCDCDVSLFETALAELSYVATWAATAGYQPQRMSQSAHPSVVPFQNFETADGWIVVACPKQKFWERLCVALDQSELASDARFLGFADRLHNRDELLAILTPLFRSDTSTRWLQRLGDAGVPSAPVNDVPGALQEDQVGARAGLTTIEHPRFGQVRQVASPLRLSGEQRRADRAPFLGEHTIEVLAEVCSYGPEQIAEVSESGALGPMARDDEHREASE